MNMGVCTTPCGVEKDPALALFFWPANVNANEFIDSATSYQYTRQYNIAMITLQDIDYDLPQELIAQQPIDQRDQSRLLALNRKSGAISHHHFFDLPTLLRPGDVLVRNNSRVIPARLFGQKPSGGKVEVLLLQCTDREKNEWECLCRPGLQPKQVLTFPNSVSGVIIEHVRDDLVHKINFSIDYEQFMSVLETIGETPLPPYINLPDHTSAHIRDRYQTTYAKAAGSAAAPTAGLHFTKALDKQLIERGIVIEEVVLHVGLGTFAPIREHDIRRHKMHKEWFSLDAETAARLNTAKQEGHRIIAVGTTTVRVLESCTKKQTSGEFQLEPRTDETKIFIYPPYHFKFVDGLITNFHLPKSSLLLLVSAFASAPNTHQVFKNFQNSSVGKAYAEAIKMQYRFFSFGDAMLITQV
jgi:S-adenosylmethionine:tRNA ribosyltransferase-isomerase